MLVNQARAFTSTIVIGMSAGLLYDYYRAIREFFRLKKTGTFIGDVIYWLVTTAVVFLMLLWGTRGELRLYVLIGIGLGALLYFRLFSRTACRVFRLKFYAIYRAWALLLLTLHRVWLVATLPVRLFMNVLSYPWRLLRRTAGKMVRVLKSALPRPAGGLPAGLRRKAARLVFWRRKKDD